MSSTNYSYRFLLILCMFLFGAACLIVAIFPSKAPVVISYSFPSSPIDPQIRLTFSEEVDKQTVEAAFSTEPHLDGLSSWSGKTFVYTLNDNLHYNTHYDVELRAGVQSVRGIEMDVWSTSFTTHDYNFLYLTTDVSLPGQLRRHFLKSEEDVPLTPDSIVVKNYDLDTISNRVAFLGMLRKDFPGYVVGGNRPYILDLDSGSVQEIPDIYDADRHHIHFLKWLPFENALIFSRSRLKMNYGILTLSTEAMDTELVVYDLKTKEERVLKTGNGFKYEFYPSPDGLRVVFVNDSGALILSSIKDGAEEFIAGNFLELFGFSDYGGYILYLDLSGDGIADISQHLVLQSQRGEKQRFMEGQNFIVDQPALSPDERSFAYKHTKIVLDSFGTVFRLALYDTAHQGFELLTDPEDGSVDQPAFSPDGVYVSYLQYPPDFEISNPFSGWAEFNGSFTGAPIMLYDISENGVMDSGIVGADVRWIY